MILILEGPDGSGKSTLARKLVEQTGFKFIHRSKPESEEEKRLMLEEYLLIASSGDDIILDRCWYSEIVYGTVMRDESVISLAQMYQLEYELSRHGGAVIIYCTDEPNVLWRRCVNRGEDYITASEDFRAICEKYDEVMNEFHILPVVRYGFKE
jgi:thymidylate kinase